MKDSRQKDPPIDAEGIKACSRRLSAATPPVSFRNASDPRGVAARRCSDLLPGMSVTCFDVPSTVRVQIHAPGDLAMFRLPAGVQHRLTELLDRQDQGRPLARLNARKPKAWWIWQRCSRCSNSGAAALRPRWGQTVAERYRRCRSAQPSATSFDAFGIGMLPLISQRPVSAEVVRSRCRGPNSGCQPQARRPTPSRSPHTARRRNPS